MLENLWRSTVSAKGRFDISRLACVPEPARRYLEHAIAPGTPLVSAVRLRMHGEIKLERWFPFRAEQVIHADRGFVWATVPLFGIPLIRGFDRLIDGKLPCVVRERVRDSAYRAVTSALKPSDAGDCELWVANLQYSNGSDSRQTRGWR
jgi:hypothetical protein